MVCIFAGVIQSHKGVIGLLLNYIPNNHHSIRALLAGIKAAPVAASEASLDLRHKWAAQILTLLRVCIPWGSYGVTLKPTT
jgi:hypothetical protein